MIDIQEEYVSAKDAAKSLRTFLKQRFPKCKFAIQSDFRKIRVYLMSAPFQAILTGESYVQINPFTEHLKRDKRISKETINVFCTIKEFLIPLQDDRTDFSAIGDTYHNSNFYIGFSVGSYDKPFVQAGSGGDYTYRPNRTNKSSSSPVLRRR